MAAIDRTNYKRIQRSYYNINIYNDTNDDIEAKYSANTIVPLLDKPNQYEVSVVRASVPLDGIPISQYNIGFESWQVQFTNTVTNQTSNAYVQQFLPNIVPYSITTAMLGILGQPLKDMTINSVLSPSGDVPLTLTAFIPNVTQGLTVAGYSNITYSQSYIWFCNMPFIRRHIYGSNPFTTLDIRFLTGIGTSVVRAMCASSLNDNLYILCYDTDAGGQWFITCLTPTSTTPLNILLLDPANYPTDMNINSMACSGAQLTIGLNYPIGGPGSPLSMTKNYNITNPLAITVTYPYIYDNVTHSYIDSDNVYYTAPNSPAIIYFFKTDITDNHMINNYLYPTTSSQFVRFLGSDIWNNLLVVFLNTFNNTYSIVAYNKSINGRYLYRIKTGTQEPVSMSQFTPPVTGTNILPSLTPNYQIWNYQTYLDQINIAIATAFNGISSSTNWPSQEIPYLSYSNAKFSLNCGTGLALPICKMSFNTRLWQRFIFNSSTNTTNSDYKDLQILSLIPNIVPTTTLMITQPHSTNYRWFDITRVIVRSTKMSVAGDVELTNTSLLNITDFAIDTSAPDVFLQIYEPHILRYYQLYQTSPLNSIDVQLSYATRSGDIFAINLTAGSAASIKLLFRRSNFELAL